jgi:hypothetical protein
MQKQTKMVEGFQMMHRDFTTNLEKSLSMLEKNINEAAEVEEVCTDEWCTATENILDEVAIFIISISDHRRSSDEYSISMPNGKASGNKYPF